VSVTVNGHLFTDAGQMTCLNGAAGVPAGSPVLACWAHNANGSPSVEALVAAAVPATVICANDLCFHADGRLYVTTQAVAATDIYKHAMRFRNDGALRVSTAAVGATDVYNAAWAQAQTGEARMSIT